MSQSQDIARGCPDLLAWDWQGFSIIKASVYTFQLRLYVTHRIENTSHCRFHLRNGARLERINWLGDRSEKGLRESAGLLVNYLYDRKAVARNHETYVNENVIVRSAAIDHLVKKRPRLPSS